jgi:hypothetical protein
MSVFFCVKSIWFFFTGDNFSLLGSPGPGVKDSTQRGISHRGQLYDQVPSTIMKIFNIAACYMAYIFFYTGILSAR